MTLGGGARDVEKHTDLLHTDLRYKLIVASERLHLVYSPTLQRSPQISCPRLHLTELLCAGTSVFIMGVKAVCGVTWVTSYPGRLALVLPFGEARVAHGLRLLPEQLRAPLLEGVDPGHVFDRCLY